jgi:hypothetical protein
MKNVKKITTVFVLIFLLIGGLVSAQDRAINPNHLPKTAKTFLAGHFKGIPVSSAIEDREIYGVDEYKVYLNNGMKMEFDSNGNWKEVDGNHQNSLRFYSCLYKKLHQQKFSEYLYRQDRKEEMVL